MPAPEKTIVIKSTTTTTTTTSSTRSNQENYRPTATASLAVHNRTHVVEKQQPKTTTTKTAVNSTKQLSNQQTNKNKPFRYDDDFYRGEFSYNHLLDVSGTAKGDPMATIGAHHAANSTVIDRRQTSVISTPKLNFYRSIDSINLASDQTIGGMGGYDSFGFLNNLQK